MVRILKSEVIKLMADLKERGFTNEELAVMLNRSSQTVWCWSAETQPNRIPCKSDYEVLKRLLGTKYDPDNPDHERP